VAVMVEDMGKGGRGGGVGRRGGEDRGGWRLVRENKG
jgi:hypothetical protein